MRPDRTSRRRLRSRRGGIYLMVMVGSATVTSMALIGLSLATERRQASARAVNAQIASDAAIAAIEWGLHAIGSDPTWRTSLGDGAWLNGQALGDAEMALKVWARDGGSVADSDCQAVVLRGYGFAGTSRIMLEVEAEPEAVWPTDGIDVISDLGAIAYWPLSGEPGDRSDEISGLAAQWAGSKDPLQHAGIACGTAFDFDGSSGAMIASHNDRLRSPGTSVSLWFYLHVVDGSQVLFTKHDTSLSPGGGTIVAMFNDQLLVSPGESRYPVQHAGVQAREWHHLLVSMEGDEAAVYLNGSELWSGSIGCDWTSNTAPIIIGARSGIDGKEPAIGQLQGYTDGSIAHVSVFDRALAPMEALTIMDAARPSARMRVVPDSWRRAAD